MEWWQYLAYFMACGLGVGLGVLMMCCFFLAGKADDEMERAWLRRQRAQMEGLKDTG